MALTTTTSLFCDTAFAAKPPLELKPSSKWFLNYGEDSCRMIRDFGEAKDKVSILFGPSESEQNMGFFIADFGKNVPAILVKQQMRIGIATDAELVKIDAKNWEEDFKHTVISHEREKAVTFIRIGSPLSTPVILWTGSMGPPLTALSSCAEGLVEHWDLDANSHKNLKSKVRPTSKPRNWIRSNDYPKNMLIEGQQSLIQFRLLLDDSG